MTDIKTDFIKLISSGNIEDAFKLLHSHFPKKLFKFFPDVQNRKDAVFNNKIWFSSPETFDDPFDCAYWLANKLKVDEIIDDLEIDRNDLSDLQIIKEIIHERTLTIQNDFKNLYLVTCFSENVNSAIMWSLYGQEHKGFAVEYNIAAQQLPYLNYFVAPVNYCIQTLNLDEYLNSPTSISYLLLLSKSIEWQFQNEWRAVVKKTHSTQSHGELMDFPNVAAIYVGYKASSSLISELKVFASKHGIKIYKMSTSFETLELCPKRI